MTSKQSIKVGDFQRLLRLLSQYARPYWKATFALALVNLTAVFFAALLPLLVAPILDVALGRNATAQGAAQLSNLSLHNLGSAVVQWLGLSRIGNDFHLVLALCGCYLTVVVLHAATMFGGYLLALWIRVRSARDMQHDLFVHILSLPLSFFARQRAGELASRLDDDTSATTSGFETIITNLMMSPLLIAFYGLLLARTNWLLALAAVGGGLLHYAVTKGIQKPIRRSVADRFSSFADLRAGLHETLASIRVVKSFGAENHERRKLKQAIKNIVRVNMKYGVFKHVEQPVRSLVDGLVIVAVLAFAARELLAGRLEAATFMLFLYIARAITQPIATLGNTLTLIQTTLAASERVWELFSETPRVKDGSERVGRFTDRIVVRDVSFTYEKTPVLQGVNLEIERGMTVALVGPSGAGKSTLADLILRFYDPDEGSISMDGRDLRMLQQSSYRALFGVVSQEALLFNASVLDNITYGRDGLTKEDAVRAAQIANAHEFITELPQGYGTVVGDRGVRLSGGQRQRIAIARAVVSNPQILILDEATSALDSESERLVQEAIERVTEDTTALVIAHRLSTIVRADKIIVLEQGRIVDSGRHEELLGRCDLYRRLCELQFGASVTPSTQVST